MIGPLRPDPGRPERGPGSPIVDANPTLYDREAPPKDLRVWASAGLCAPLIRTEKVYDGAKDFPPARVSTVRRSER